MRPWIEEPLLLELCKEVVNTVVMLEQLASTRFSRASI
jgi:hypothetical protein